MKKALLIVAQIILGLGLYAQNEVDALRYSQQNIQGTARFMGMGGAFGALGADLTSFSINPAAIGVYRRNEFAFTPAVTLNSTDASFMGQTGINDRSLFQFNNIGMVGNYTSRDANVTHVNLGISYNKTASFQQNLSIQGDNSNTTLLDIFSQQANGNLGEDLIYDYPFGAGLAWETYLINPIEDDSLQYDTEIPFGDLTQRKNIERRGAMGETTLAAGANFNERVYAGISMGIPTVRFEENSIYSEFDLDEELDLNEFKYREKLLTTGSGVNFKIGFIVRASQWLRVGGAFHSPSWLTLNDSYESSISSDFKDGENFSSVSPIGSYQYRLKTPPRYLGNAAFIIGKLGVISADYEFVDYRQSKLNKSNQITDDYDFFNENRTIDNLYRGTHNVKVGMEWRLANVWRVRTGGGYSQNPFVNGSTQSNPYTITYAGGLGYRSGNIYVDMAYSLRQNESDYYLYDPALVDAAIVNSNQHNIALTLGFRY